MMLSQKTLDHLAEVVCGDNKRYPYRTGPELVRFFSQFTSSEPYGSGFPSRANFTLRKLSELNGTSKMRDVIRSAFDFFEEPVYCAEEEGSRFNKRLVRDGYRLVLEKAPGWMEGNQYIEGPPTFDVKAIGTAAVDPTTLKTLSHSSIVEFIFKANSRLESGDVSGAITISYTRVEQVLKHLLTEMHIEFNSNDGDIRALYKLARDKLNLNPSAAPISAPLKPIVTSIGTLVSGLYEVANKLGDRHALKYNPARHHAKLAINSSFTLCEFLLDSAAAQGVTKKG